MPRRARVRRQFKCSNCDGRAWPWPRDYDPAQDEPSECHRCGNPGAVVPEGEEIQLSQFQCMNEECDSCTHAWYERAERSKCNCCKEYGRQVPAGEEVEWRQFYCAHCNERWIDMATRSKCVECGGDAEVVPKGEEIGVYDCKFKCSAAGCTNEYPVTCKMSNKAVCYKCKHLNTPYAFEPRNRRRRRKTEKKHSCDECNGSGKCPNLRRKAVTYGPRRRHSARNGRH